MKYIILYLIFFMAAGCLAAQESRNHQVAPPKSNAPQKDVSKDKVIVLPKEKDKADSILENPYYIPMVPSNKSVHFSMPVISGNGNSHFSTPVLTDSTMKLQKNKSPLIKNKTAKKVEIIKKKK